MKLVGFQNSDRSMKISKYFEISTFPFSHRCRFNSEIHFLLSLTVSCESLIIKMIFINPIFIILTSDWTNTSQADFSRSLLSAKILLISALFLNKTMMISENALLLIVHAKVSSDLKQPKPHTLRRLCRCSVFTLFSSLVCRANFHMANSMIRTANSMTCPVRKDIGSWNCSESKVVFLKQTSWNPYLVY